MPSKISPNANFTLFLALFFHKYTSAECEKQTDLCSASWGGDVAISRGAEGVGVGVGSSAPLETQQLQHLHEAGPG